MGRRSEITQVMILQAIFLAAVLTYGCKKAPEPDTEITTVADYDGNVYPVVKIFNQYWMAENLKTTRLNDGTPITLASDHWFFDKQPSRCFYNNDGASFRDTYGMLYNMYAAYTGKLCPVGWHVPKQSDWNTLSGYLTGHLAGGKLKETGTEHWSSPNTGADNSTGFTARPGGQINQDGTFSGLGNYGRWWIDNSPAGAIIAEIRHDSQALYWNGSGIYFGHSVRCIKNP